MPVSVGQELTNYYINKTQRKCTNQLYIRYMSSMKALLKAGYSEFDIKRVIDYLIDHPPKNGFTPPFLQYVMDDTLQKIKVNDMRKIEVFFEPSKEEETSDNAEKFKKQGSIKIKGLVDF